MEAVTSDIPRSVQDILVGIKYISGLPPGKKYDIGTKSYVSSTNFFTQRRRDWVDETHIKALDFINTTITEAIEVCKKFPRWKQLICAEVGKTSNALANVKHVYHKYPSFIAEVDVAILRINSTAFLNACVEERNEERADNTI